ncbi:alpha-glucosidase [Bacillus mangrovi]|uniref:Alpha-glucosidase n=1 Tax=Metabacillus mangrovi TaxID=1491830 RepID=A0A7X2V5K6_9BACI|nr:glycoside hydrolase family 31 protein [Metabacillus mangrovi]MTH54271.1 alpha-glucosidase [Metabacillus mangrovi]
MSLLPHHYFLFTGSNGNVLQFRGQETIVRLFILEHGLIRVLFTKGPEPQLGRTWSIAPGLEDLPFEGRDRLDTSGFSLPDYFMQQTGQVFSIRTGRLQLEIELDGFKISWFFKEGGGDWIPVARDRRTQAYIFSEGPAHYLERDPEEQYFGLGEKTGPVNKHGRRYRMQPMDAMGYDAETTDPLYKHLPFYITRNPKSGISYGLFYDHYCTSVFDMGAELDQYHGLYRYFQAEAGDLDYYFLAGPQVRDVTETYAWMTGRTVFPPKWSLGYSGSSMSYTEAPDSQEKLGEFLESCSRHDIPCSSFQLSSGYTSIGGRRYVFHWNRSKFPDPGELAETFAASGVKLCANVKPALLKDHPLFEEAKELFIQNADTGEPEMAQYWDGAAAFLDFTKAETVSWWKAKVTETLLHYGIASLWNDNNEYEIWGRTAVCSETLPFHLVRALQPLLMMKASFEAQKEHSPEKRPYLISRSGAPGMQRYVQTWTGDNRTSWKTLKYNIRMGIGLSLSGIYNFGHDVGGFSGPAPDPELFVRWIENGVMHPRFTIHSWNEDGTVNEPWMYPDMLPYVKKLMDFRTEILPYLYTALYEAHMDDKPVIRPVFYDHEQDEKTFTDCDDFMLGDSLLAASVTEPGQTERSVYLPVHEGGWYEYHSGKWHEGGRTAIMPAPLGQVPLLVKGGSILPVQLAEERGLLVFPAKEKAYSSFHFFEDDGESLLQKGSFAVLHAELLSNAEEIQLQIWKEGGFVLPYKTIELRFPEAEKRKLVINGTDYGRSRTAVFHLKEGGRKP